MITCWLLGLLLAGWRTLAARLLMMLSVVPFLLVFTAIVKLTRDRLARDEPERFRRAVDRSDHCLAHPWIGPFLACWCLSMQMVASYTPRSRYSICTPLRLSAEEEAAEATRARTTRGETAETS